MKTYTVYYSVGNDPKEYSVEVEAPTSYKALMQVDYVLRLNGQSYAISLQPPFKKEKSPG